ncbi:MAG: knotted carbamoyltransferase YgeW [Desulfobacteraceae bacterium]|nr:MAG: knotted carbamoyltransferase YgeW [Desulfobacteraceae bacterium]
MKQNELEKTIERLGGFKAEGLYANDFLLTWDKTDDELAAVFQTAEVLRHMRQSNCSPRVFDSGLALSLFKDQSTRTRFSFASACNLLGLAVQDFDEAKSQVAHGETVRETVTMLSFLAEVIGIRDDIFPGLGHAYMQEVARAAEQGFREGVLPQRPVVVNLQCDIDHPTQTLADTLHLIHHFGGLENLKGKKIVMSWAYSPSYGKPMSVPQGIIGLMTRFGMEVVLAHPEGYELMPEVLARAEKNSRAAGGSFRAVQNMGESFQNADVVYPKSWAPLAVMRERTDLLQAGKQKELKELEAGGLQTNKKFRDWQCTEALMKTTRDGQALYMHCLPADITGVNCERGEVEASVFERYRIAQYQQAGYKPYVIAAMIFLAKFEKPTEKLAELLKRNQKREGV